MHVLTNQDIPLDMTRTKHGVTQVAGFKTVSNFQVDVASYSKVCFNCVPIQIECVGLNTMYIKHRTGHSCLVIQGVLGFNAIFNYMYVIIDKGCFIMSVVEV